MKQQFLPMILLWCHLLNAKTLYARNADPSFHRKGQAFNSTENQNCKPVNTADIVVVKRPRLDPRDDKMADEGLVLYCVQGVRTEAECLAARQGKVPKQDKHNNIFGELKVELTNVKINENSVLLTEMESILVHQTAPAFIGCVDSKNYSEWFNVTNQGNMADNNIQVSGLIFGDIVFEGGCIGLGRKNETKPPDCIKIGITFEILYQGQIANKNEESEMFALLLETLRDQVVRGDFDEVGDVLSFETRDASLTEREAKGFVSRGSPGLPLVVVLASIVLFFFVVAFRYCRQKSNVIKKFQNDQGPKNKKLTDQPSQKCSVANSPPCKIQPTTNDDASVVEDSAEAISCLPNCCYLSETTTYSY